MNKQRSSTPNFRISWGSCCSASYASGALRLNSHQFAVIEFGEDQIMVRAFGSRWVRFTQVRKLESSDGAARATFALNENGTVTSVDGKMDEMDFAAERLTRELMQ